MHDTIAAILDAAKMLQGTDGINSYNSIEDVTHALLFVCSRDKHVPFPKREEMFQIAAAYDLNFANKYDAPTK